MKRLAFWAGQAGSRTWIVNDWYCIGQFTREIITTGCMTRVTSAGSPRLVLTGSTWSWINVIGQKVCPVDLIPSAAQTLYSDTFEEGWGWRGTTIRKQMHTHTWRRHPCGEHTTVWRHQTLLRLKRNTWTTGLLLVQHYKQWTAELRAVRTEWMMHTYVSSSSYSGIKARSCIFFLPCTTQSQKEIFFFLQFPLVRLGLRPGTG